RRLRSRLRLSEVLLSTSASSFFSLQPPTFLPPTFPTPSNLLPPTSTLTSAFPKLADFFSLLLANHLSHLKDRQQDSHNDTEHQDAHDQDHDGLQKRRKSRNDPIDFSIINVSDSTQHLLHFTTPLTDC